MELGVSLTKTIHDSLQTKQWVHYVATYSQLNGFVGVITNGGAYEMREKYTKPGIIPCKNLKI